MCRHNAIINFKVRRVKFISRSGPCKGHDYCEVVQVVGDPTPLRTKPSIHIRPIPSKGVLRIGIFLDKLILCTEYAIFLLYQRKT